MTQPNIHRTFCKAALACAMGLAAGAACAAPAITRLTPPSNPPAAGADTLARFLPGQRFDLQATVQPQAGRRITVVTFSVDGRVLLQLRHDGSPADQFEGRSSLVKNGLAPGLEPGSVVASMRAFALERPGLHELTVTATDSSGETAQAQGRFEIVGLRRGGAPAKNIIIMLGDGMGAAHRTAARIVAKGYLQGKAQGRLAMDTLPVTGMVMTASLNSIVTDSAPGMSNYVTGNKAANNQEGVFPDDTLAAFDNPRVEYLAEYLHRRKGSALGLVTTADVEDATPAANAVHTAYRGAGTGIVDQYLDDRGLTGLRVLMGGGRQWFLPRRGGAGSARAASSDYTLPPDLIAGWGTAPGVIDAGRDLLADFGAAGYAYASDRHTLQALLASGRAPDKLLGLFAGGNMNVAWDKLSGRRGSSSVVRDAGYPDQPMLDEMTEAALQVLERRNSRGFVLMVEGASIDKQSHLMDADRWVLEVIEFDRAVQKAKDYAARHPDTLVIVTADHECSGAAIIGAAANSKTGVPVAPETLHALADGDDHTPAAQRDAVVGIYDAARFPRYAQAEDGYPLTTDVPGKLLIGYGANADREEDWLAKPRPAPQAPASGPAAAQRGVLIVGQVPGETAAHTATDVPLSAFGRGAGLFSGVYDNTDVFFKLAQIAAGGLP